MVMLVLVASAAITFWTLMFVMYCSLCYFAVGVPKFHGQWHMCFALSAAFYIQRAYAQAGTKPRCQICIWQHLC